MLRTGGRLSRQCGVCWTTQAASRTCGIHHQPQGILWLPPRQLACLGCQQGRQQGLRGGAIEHSAGSGRGGGAEARRQAQQLGQPVEGDLRMELAAFK